jgi:hypothetical protein
MRVIPVRAVVIIVTVILFVATVACVAAAAFGNWRFGLPTHDKTTVINTVVAVGAFVLVAWGVIVALAAYVSATGSPDLSVELRFEWSEVNKPVFVKSATEIDDDLTRSLAILDNEGTLGTLVISNSSKYAARNPGVRITLQGLGRAGPQEGWVTIAETPYGPPEGLQWDGGADFIIHGQWSRTLPVLNFAGMGVDRLDPAFIIDIAADGFGPKTTTIPVRILDKRGFAIYSGAFVAQQLKSGIQAARKGTTRKQSFLKRLMRSASRTLAAPSKQ